MRREINYSAISNLNLRRCFLLGIMPRSGSNFFNRLLRLHPDCETRSEGEDFFVHHSHLLVKYVNSLYRGWRPRWKVDDTMGSRDRLLNYFGDAILRFMDLQLPEDNPADSDIEPLVNSRPKFLVTKTPSVLNIRNYPRLFPNTHLLILLRDGRAIVESGMRSFDWDFENATKEFALAAQTIIEFQKSIEYTNQKCLTVKYEDLVTNTEEELRKVFSFLGLFTDTFDFDAAKSLSVTGSSESRDEKRSRPSWTPVEKTPDFNPLGRWEHWSKEQHEQFNSIAGEYLSLLGYTCSS
ncbi:MAG: sulfotransferase [Dehalococcoidia bacterium]